MSARVFHQAAAWVGVSTAAPAVVGLWAAGPIGAAGLGVAALTANAVMLRRNVLRAVPSALTFASSSPADHPWLDLDGFRVRLRDLEAMGFQPVADFAVTYDGAPDGHARLLVHPANRVYAEVDQLRLKGVAGSVETTIYSMLDDGWSLQTTSRAPDASIPALLSIPRGAWQSRPGAEAADLLDAHLELRGRMSAELRVAVAGDGSVETYFARRRDEHLARRRALGIVGVLRGVARGVGFERRPTHAWLGDFRPATPPA